MIIVVYCLLSDKFLTVSVLSIGCFFDFIKSLIIIIRSLIILNNLNLKDYYL